jgi:hypothetical protein
MAVTTRLGSWRTLGIAAVLLLSPHAARASSITFDLDDVLVLLPGGAGSFLGTVTNNDAVEDVYLNTLSLTFSGPIDITFDVAPFFLLPFPLGPGATAGPISFIDVLAALSAPKGTYMGSATIFGGATDLDLDDLGTQDFTIVVVPEPMSLSLIGIGVAGVALRRRRRRAA